MLCAPITHDCLDASMPRPPLPTSAGTTVSLAASTILAPCFYTPREAHPKRCTLFFSCQSDQSPDLLLSRQSGHLGQRRKSSRRKTEWIGSSHLHPE
ncbi:mCG147660 [Mus musculus]|nr:mCG147660 [Mus musculus]